MSTAASGVTKPAQGVIATIPAMAPLTIPSEEGLPRYQLANIQASPPAAAAEFVLTNAITALVFVVVILCAVSR